MFHLYITIAYIIPGIYLYFRVKDLFISKEYRLVFTIIYLLILSIYPLTERIPDETTNSFMKGLISVSGYILPFLLYFFLFVLLIDLFLLANHWLKLISHEKRMSYSFRFYGIVTVILLSAMVVIAGIINLNTIRISEYSIEIPRKNSEMDHLKVAFTSDIHIQQNTRIQFIEQFVRKINALKPDLVLYGGDIIEGDSGNETTMAVQSALQRITARYGVFGVYGNHEHYAGKNQNRFFRELGITILCDTVTKIDSLFYLAGRNDQHIDQRKSVFQLMGIISDDLPVILLDHRPTELQEVSRTKVDIQFSGHTHNGQLFPINLVTNSAYELSWGYKKIKNTHFFVTSGLRLWGPPVRTAGKSEIMLVDIYFK